MVPRSILSLRRFTHRHPPHKLKPTSFQDVAELWLLKKHSLFMTRVPSPGAGGAPPGSSLGPGRHPGPTGNPGPETNPKSWAEWGVPSAQCSWVGTLSGQKRRTAHGLAPRHDGALSTGRPIDGQMSQKTINLMSFARFDLRSLWHSIGYQSVVDFCMFY